LLFGYAFEFDHWSFSVSVVACAAAPLWIMGSWNKGGWLFVLLTKRMENRHKQSK
jgi:O-antigen ligase